jgi:hypothetical protein
MDALGEQEGEAPPLTEAAFLAAFPRGAAVAQDGGGDLSLDWLGGEAAVREGVLRALASADRSTSGGPSGLRQGHLRDLAVADPAVTGVVAGWAVELLKGRHGGFAGAARLRCIPKGNGGIRPLSVGEAIPSLAKKVVAATLAESVLEELEGAGQMGLSPHGCERVAGAAQAALSAGKGLALLDLANAFNVPPRERVLGAMEGEAEPFIRRWLAPGRLVTELGEREVQSGVPQGDPLSTAVFAVFMAKTVGRALQEAVVGTGFALVAVRGAADVAGLGVREVGLAMYADDMTLMGSGEGLEAVMSVAEAAMAGVGMRLALHKTKRLGLGADEAGLVLGIPVGVRRDVVVGLLKEEVATKLRKREQALDRLRAPLAGLVLARSSPPVVSVSNMLTGAKWVSEEAVDVVVEHERRDVMRALRGGEGPGSVALAYLPAALGGLGLRGVRRELVRAGSGMRAATEEESQAADEVLLRIVQGDEFAAAQRKDAASAKGGVARALLMEAAATIDETRDPAVEGQVVALLLAAPFHGAVSGRPCPGSHSGVPPELCDGVGCHALMCG